MGLRDPKQTEIAYFGGSFTALPVTMQTDYLAIAQQVVQAHGLQGIRLSTRPDAIDEATLERLERYGVTAIELGAQSMNDRVLQQNKRGHTADDVRHASRLIQQAGFELGLQMMTGLYGDDDEIAIQTVHAIATLHPDTVRIYPTVVLPDTLLADLWQQGVYHPPSLDATVTLCATLLDLFEERQIRVIKVGLHAEQEVASHMIGGCYHPAFRELCDNERYYRKLLVAKPKDGQTVLVARGELSKAIGQKKQNLTRLQQQKQVAITIKESDTVLKGQLEIQQEV